MKNYTLVLAFILLISFSLVQFSFAHGGEKHGSKGKKSEAKTEVTETKHDTVKSELVQQQVPEIVSEEEHKKHEADPGSVHASLDDFPNRHPLVVHFPIVLLLVAAGVQLANIFFLQKSLDWVTTIAVLVSFGAAYYVTKIDHPHTDGLTAHAKLVLEQHDFYANWTIYLAGIALVAQLLNQFLFNGKRWSVAVVAFILVGAAYSVAMAGHYGAQLVFIEGVGPQSKYLDTGHQH
jgi:uncharacterized membrane protein